MKTIKQIAENLHVDKQQVYRFIKRNHINEARRDVNVMWFDDVAIEMINRGFKNDIPHQKANQEAFHEAVYETLLKQLEMKDRQIENLEKLLDQEQKLRNMEQQKYLELKTTTIKKKFWRRS